MGFICTHVPGVVKGLCERRLPSRSATDVTLLCSVCLVLPTPNTDWDAWVVLLAAQIHSHSPHALKQRLAHADCSHERTGSHCPAWASHPKPDPARHLYPRRQLAAHCEQATECSAARL